MDYTTLPLEPRLMAAEASMPAMSLYQALQQLPDPRRAQGKRYELALILSLLVLAKLAGQKTLSGATQWIRHRASSLAEHFGLQREDVPCQMTYCTILAAIDGKQLDDLLAAFFVRWEAQSRCGEEPSRLLTPDGSADHAQLAIDGKALRATSLQAHPVHQLSCYDVATGSVLWCVSATALLIVDDGKRRKPGTKGMDDWNTARSSVALISTSGLARTGRALSQCFAWSAQSVR